MRFHLFPDIEVNVTGSKKKAILKLPDGTGWEFICSEPKIEIKESIYLGQEQKIAKNSHILVSDIIIPEKKLIITRTGKKYMDNGAIEITEDSFIYIDEALRIVDN